MTEDAAKARFSSLSLSLSLFSASSVTRLPSILLPLVGSSSHTGVSHILSPPLLSPLTDRAHR